MDEYRFVKSQKGKDKLVFREHIYRHSRSRNNNHYFTCEDKTCNGSATLRAVPTYCSMGGSVSEGQAHDHDPQIGRIEAMKAVAEIKSRAKVLTSAPAAIYQEVRQTLNVNSAVEMPSTAAVRQAIHRVRKQDIPVEPECAKDVVIPDNLKVTASGERNFLLFDRQIQSANDEGNERIIAFGSEDNLRRLAARRCGFLMEPSRLVHVFSNNCSLFITRSKVHLFLLCTL